jgi:hypothetical protein
LPQAQAAPFGVAEFDDAMAAGASRYSVDDEVAADWQDVAYHCCWMRGGVSGGCRWPAGP